MESKLNTDVDFGKNLNENQSRGTYGYGVYKKQYESDALENIVANCENDRDLNKRREM